MAELFPLPSVQVDDVVEDTLDATQGSCLGTEVETFMLANGDFTIAVDGGAPQTITFNEVFFADISAATAQECVDSINTQVVGATASVEGGAVRVTSDTYGASSSILIADGTLGILAGLGFTGALCSGADSTTAVVLFNRQPEPGEVQVAASATIIFELFAASGTAPATVDLTVTVEGVVAYDGAGFVNGWSGATSNPTADRLRVELTPPAPWASGQVVDVQVQLSTPTFDESYSFTAFDSTPPIIADVQARGKDQLRVTFAEPVKMVSPTGTMDALNPANYTIERLTRPSVAAVVTSVVKVDASTVDLFTDIELTFATDYLLVARSGFPGPGIADVNGNEFQSPNNTFTFVAFAPPFPVGRRFRLADFVPSLNKAEDASQELELFIGCLQEIVNLLLCEIDRWTDIIDVDAAAEQYLDAMLSGLGNPFTGFTLSEEDKQRLIPILVDIYKEKGTEPGIINAIRFFLGIEVTIDILNGEGWELTSDDATDTTIGDELNGPGTESPNQPATLGPDKSGLYSFFVVSPVVLTTTQRERMVSIVELMKPAHTHLVDIIDPTPIVPIDCLELGACELGSTAAGGSPGTWILH